MPPPLNPCALQRACLSGGIGNWNFGWSFVLRNLLSHVYKYNTLRGGEAGTQWQPPSDREAVSSI